MFHHFKNKYQSLLHLLTFNCQVKMKKIKQQMVLLCTPACV